MLPRAIRLLISCEGSIPVVRAWEGSTGDSGPSPNVMCAWFDADIFQILCFLIASTHTDRVGEAFEIGCRLDAFQSKEAPGLCQVPYRRNRIVKASIGAPSALRCRPRSAVELAAARILRRAWAVEIPER